MVYDLFACFYSMPEDKEAKYRCPIGLYTKGEDSLLRNGFNKTKDPYYVDYVKEVSETELQGWVKNGYISEVMDVIYSGEDFDRIVLEALMIEPIDDEGTLPERMLQLGNLSVTFTDSEPQSSVHFHDESDNKSVIDISISLQFLKNIFRVLTLMEVMTYLQNADEKLIRWMLEQYKVISTFEIIENR